MTLTPYKSLAALKATVKFVLASSPGAYLFIPRGRLTVTIPPGARDPWAARDSGCRSTQRNSVLSDLPRDE